jgi:hypothetical protein
MGFQLLGIWLFGLLPVLSILGILTFVVGRYGRPTSEWRFIGVTSLIYLLVFLAFLFDYRCGGPF